MVLFHAKRPIRPAMGRNSTIIASPLGSWRTGPFSESSDEPQSLNAQGILIERARKTHAAELLHSRHLAMGDAGDTVYHNFVS